MQTVKRRVQSPKDDRGASLVEYAMLVALIAMVCFVAVIFLGEASSDGFTSSGSSLFPG